MLKRNVAFMFMLIFAMYSGSLSAKESGIALELKQLQAMLSIVNSELRSNLDQIFILQEAIKANARTPLDEQGRSPDPVSFDNVVAAQRLAIERELALNIQFDAIIAQSAALQAKKQAIVERVIELNVTPATTEENIPKTPK